MTWRQWSEPHGWGTNYTDAKGCDIESSFSYSAFNQWRQPSPLLSGVLAYRPLPHLDVALLSLPLGMAAARLVERTFIPTDFHLQTGFDGYGLALAAGLAAVAGLLLGLLPALRLTRRGAADPGVALAEKGGRRWLGEALLAGELALCLIVLSLAGVFGRTLRNLQAAPKGLEARQVTLFQLDPPLEGYSGARLATYDERVTERLRSIPGVEGATITSIITGGDGCLIDPWHWTCAKPAAERPIKP